MKTQINIKKVEEFSRELFDAYYAGPSRFGTYKTIIVDEDVDPKDVISFAKNLIHVYEMQNTFKNIGFFANGRGISIVNTESHS